MGWGEGGHKKKRVKKVESSDLLVWRRYASRGISCVMQTGGIPITIVICLDQSACSK